MSQALLTLAEIYPVQPWDEGRSNPASQRACSSGLRRSAALHVWSSQRLLLGPKSSSKYPVPVHT